LRELGSLIQKELRDMDEIVEALKEINADGIDISMVSMGDKGAVLCTKDLCLRVKVPHVETVNTIGSGDAMVAGFAADLQETKQWKSA